MNQGQPHHGGSTAASTTRAGNPEPNLTLGACLKGGLEGKGRCWWLLDGQVESVLPIPDEDAAPEGEQL